MGTWGTGILDNDDALDVYNPYVDNSRNGYEPLMEGIEDLLYSNGRIALNDNAMGWLGLAKAKLDTNTIDADIIDIVETILSDKIDFELWEDEQVLLDEWTTSIEKLCKMLKEEIIN
jgi:hypothetical protein